MISVVKMIRIWVVLAALLFMSGCAGPVELRSLAGDHPASPGALEAPVDEPQRALAEEHQSQTVAPTPAEEHQHPTATPEMDGMVLYICPMHEHITSMEPGNCTICGMTLKQVDGMVLYSCPMHEHITSMEPGNCTICGMTLKQVEEK